MAKYLLTAAYGPEGVKGLLENGATPRRENATRTITGLGGSVEAFYYQFEDDAKAIVTVICDLPDTLSAETLWLHFNASGRVTGNLVKLVTVEDIDEAAILHKKLTS